MPSKDSSELLWDDINRPKFYLLLTCASAAIRTCLYPAALVKTRLQASGTEQTQNVRPRGNTGNGSAMLHGRHGFLSMPTYDGTGHAFRTILRTEGKFALYRGFRMNLLGLACDPIVIGCIEFSRTRLTYYSKTFTPYKDGHYESPFFRYVMSPSTAITLISAGGSACVGQIIQVPVDVISQKKQMQMHPLQTSTGTRTTTPGTSSIAIARQIIHEEGVKGLYKGFGVTLCSAMPFTAILWAVYWPTQRFLHTGLTRPSSASPPFSATLPPGSIGLPTERQTHPPVTLRLQDLPDGAHLPSDEVEYLREEKRHKREREQDRRTPHTAFHAPPPLSFNWRESIPTPIAAFVASATASLATQPIDVIKTRLQVAGGSKTTLMSTIRQLLKERGYRSEDRWWMTRSISWVHERYTHPLCWFFLCVSGLTSGWYPRILAVSPGTTIMMSSYEVLKRYCQK